jgi:lipid-binding SYLF domain-containing protein
MGERRFFPDTRLEATVPLRKMIQTQKKEVQTMNTQRERFQKVMTVGLAVALAGTLVLGLGSNAAWASTAQMEKLEAAGEVLKELVALPEQGIPEGLLKNAHGIAVIPSLVKAGYFFGGRYGWGVLSARGADGSWSPPVFITVAGGSFGLQIGVEASDVVLVFKTKRSVDAVMRSQFTLGADVSIAAGPVGRHAEAATDAQLKAEIYSYAKSKGLYAGVALEGALVQVNHGDNAAFYGQTGLRSSDILSGRVRSVPQRAQDFAHLLSQHTTALH